MVVSRGVIMLSLICIKQKHNSHLLSTLCRSWNIEGGGEGGGGWGEFNWVNFCWVCAPASQNPYYTPSWSI